MYFEYNDKGNQTSRRVIASLLKQVVSRLEDIPSDLMGLLDEYELRGKFPDFDELLTRFVGCLSQFDCVYILLDAFDECDAEHQENILRLIRRLQSSSAMRTKTMVTSRPHPRGFWNLSRSAITITIIATDEDVRTYLHAKLAKEQHLPKMLKSEIMEHVSKNANGLYRIIFVVN